MRVLEREEMELGVRTGRRRGERKVVGSFMVGVVVVADWGVEMGFVVCIIVVFLKHDVV